MKPALWTTARAPQIAAAVSLLCASLSPVHAQSLPNAGDVERSVAPPLMQAPRAVDNDAVQVTRPAPVSAPALPPTLIPIKGVKISGATVFGDDVLRPLVSGVVGKSVTLAELQAAAQRITDHYEQAGYAVARAVLPAQDLTDGVVEFLVLEGRVGAVSVDNRSRISDERVRSMLGELPPGSLVHEPTLERRLLLLGETPGASRATVALEPGQRTGETALAVQIEPGPRASGQVDVDNHGNRYTGYHRVAAQVNISSPLGLGDQVQLRGLLTDENLRNVRLLYKAPVGGSGLTVGGAWSDIHYELGREYSAARARGWSRVGSLFASYPVRRSLDFNLLATLTYDDKSFEDRIDAAGAVTRKDSRLVSLGINSYGNLGTSTAYALAAVWSAGELDIRTPAVRAEDATSGRTQGHFSKLAGTGNVTWTVASNWALHGSIYGQLASRNLDSSEKLSLGGAAGVRAYPQGEASGDEGYIVSAEVRYTVPLRPLQLAAFVDYGGIRVNHNPYLPGSNSRFLQGVGASLTWAPRPDMGIKVMMASRLGEGKVVSEPDARTRWWLQWVWRF